MCLCDTESGALVTLVSFYAEVAAEIGAVEIGVAETRTVEIGNVNEPAGAKVGNRSDGLGPYRWS